MTKETDTKLTACLAILIFVPLSIFGIINLSSDPHLKDPEFHWVKMEENAWAYAPKEDGGPIWSPNVDMDREPVGGIEKTDQGAWKTMWRGKPCGAGEYLNRELAEQCIEKAAKDDGFLGYHQRGFKQYHPAVDPYADLPKGYVDLPHGKCSISMYGIPLNCPDPTPKGEVKPTADPVATAQPPVENWVRDKDGKLVKQSPEVKP